MVHSKPPVPRSQTGIPGFDDTGPVQIPGFFQGSQVVRLTQDLGFLDGAVRSEKEKAIFAHENLHQR